MTPPKPQGTFLTNYNKMKAHYEKHAAKAAKKKSSPKKKPKVKPREEFWLVDEYPFDSPWRSA